MLETVSKFSRKHPKTSAVCIIIVVFLAVIISVCISWRIAYKIGLNDAPPTIIHDSPHSGSGLPGEKTKRVVTKNEIDMQLAEIKELSTYSGLYHVTYSEDFSRLIGETVIPGTTNVITFECDGVIKVGYNLDNISYKIDDDKIELKLPEPEILDNYIIWDSVTCDEKNNIFNPINFSEYQVVIESIERQGEEQAEEKKIYASAEKNMELLIKNALSMFSDYSVKFVD